MAVTAQRKLRRQMVIRRYAPIDPPLPYSTIQPDPRNELTPPLISRYTLIIFQPEPELGVCDINVDMKTQGSLIFAWT